MLTVLLIFIPLLAGVSLLALPKMEQKQTLLFSVLAASTVLLLNIYIVANYTTHDFNFNMPWLKALNSNFALHLDGIGALMTLLMSIGFVLIFLSTDSNKIVNHRRFYGLMLMSLAGLQGVFLAYDAFVFYFFWELALIPVYFLCSMYGGENRIAVTFKFFIYTFIGSLMMLLALIYMYNKTADHSFSWESFAMLEASLSVKEQTVLFALMFIAFAIKMPIFPFHTWQPDAYQQSFTPVTMVLSALMVKMGLFGVIRWIIPALPNAFLQYNFMVIAFCAIGIVYASVLALAQTDLKRMVAYSSIAHIGLMCAAIFSAQMSGFKGAGIQMFSHGISVLGMWIIVNYIEKRLHTTNMLAMGGLAKYAQVFVIFLLIVSFANIALPLTNGFPGEFLMFNGLYESATTNGNGIFVHNKTMWQIGFVVVAGLGVILGALYTLKMVQRVAYGEKKYENIDWQLSLGEMIALGLVAAMIIYFGFYPGQIFNLLKDIMGLTLKTA